MTTQERGKLCLNMIVKNESRIITRLLESAMPLIDTYCICDTGSTDNTIEVIRDFMEKAGKSGEVYVEPFRDFGYNRSHALERAKKWGEYALLLDADMKLVITPEFDKSQLTKDSYMLIQKNSAMEYYNVRIVKTDIGVKCVCPTHEYYDHPPGAVQEKLTSLWIDDIGDGGCKSDKFERDIRLLTKALETEPNNPRYYFYLANSYRDSGKNEEAIKAYKKRVEIGGWVEEVFYSCYEMGNVYRRMNDMPNALYWWMEGYNRHPKRAESLYEIVKYYRETGKQHIAQLFNDIARKIPYPKDDVLFIKGDIYHHLLHYEQTILTYYTHAPLDMYKYLELIGIGQFKENLLDNYKFYTKKLAELPGATVHTFHERTQFTVNDKKDTFISSSPCLLPYNDTYLLNVRYVDYSINKDGSYQLHHPDKKITTLNRLYCLNKKLKIIDDHLFDQLQHTHTRYQGIEDIKIFSHNGLLLFCGTTQCPTTHKLRIGHGVYDVKDSCLRTTPFDSPMNRDCEKNWVFTHNKKGDLRMIYEWSPLTVATPNLITNKLDHLQTDKNVPNFFKDLRGSSNGCIYKDEVWFLCHLVHHRSPREYYHIMVVLDAETLKYKRHSILFKLKGDAIEFSLSLVVEEERFLITYSCFDCTSFLLELPRSVEKLLFP